MNTSAFDLDIRSTAPNENGYRRAQFHEGWRKAAVGVVYQDETLVRLTWNNLGYRLGALFGPTPPEQIDVMYDWCVRQQETSIDAHHPTLA